MSNPYASLDAVGQTSLAQRILATIVPVVPRTDDEQEYRYLDAATGREFEIRRSQGFDDKNRSVLRYFMSEFTPTGMVCVYREGRLIDCRKDPLIAATEESVGPNELFATLREQGFDLDTLPRAGGGYGLGCVYHPSLESCAAAIAKALADNERYSHHVELSEQQRVAQKRQDAISSHAYWSQERCNADKAHENEMGIFKGCRSMLGPLTEDVKRRILAYLNKPSLADWLKIRGFVVTGSGTLWQAWCNNDPRAPRSGDSGHPSKTQLEQAIRAAVEARDAEIQQKLARSAPKGLRVV